MRVRSDQPDLIAGALTPVVSIVVQVLTMHNKTNTLLKQNCLAYNTLQPTYAPHIAKLARPSRLSYSLQI